jgi:uncharacterized protein (DUF488 family)
VTPPTRLLTVGHSSHELEVFLHLLTAHAVSAVADVRSVPASRFSPQFNRDPLKRALGEVGVKYVFLGKELGARSEDPTCYVDGQVQYSRLAETPAFDLGVTRLLEGAKRERIAVMCTERDPLDCHRTLLVARHLTRRGAVIDHILADATLEPHRTAMLRLRKMHGLADEDLFHTDEELLLEALSRQEARIAYVDHSGPDSDEVPS